MVETLRSGSGEGSLGHWGHAIQGDFETLPLPQSHFLLPGPKGSGFAFPSAPAIMCCLLLPET